MKTLSTTFPILQRSLRAILLQSITLATLAAASASAQVIYSTPYPRADPHSKNYHISIDIESGPGAVLCDPSQMVIEIAFNKTLFFPRSVTQGTIMSNIVNDTFRILTISLAGAPQVANGALTEIVGDVLLGNSESTPLKILSIKCNNVPVTDSIRSGDLAMTGRYCEANGDRLLGYRDGFGISKIAPNPARGDVTINVMTVELDETLLEIYSSYGELLFTTSWTPSNDDAAGFTRDITLPAELPNGLYEVVLRSPARRDTKTLIIAK